MILKKKLKLSNSYKLFSGTFRGELELKNFNSYYLINECDIYKSLSHHFTNEISHLIYNLLCNYKVFISIKYFNTTSKQTIDSIQIYVKNSYEVNFKVLNTSDYIEIHGEISFLTCDKVSNLYLCISDLNEDIYITFYGQDESCTHKIELSIDYCHPVLNIICDADISNSVIDICTGYVV